jgi:protein ImuB
MLDRYACLVVPSFPVAAVRRSRPELRGHAVAAVAGSPPAVTVIAADRPALAAGVRPGMTGPEAQARVPGLTLVPQSPACQAAAHAALLDVSLGVSPRVEDGGAGVVCLDLAGLFLLYRDERRLAEDLAARVAEVELPASVAIASTRTAARLAAAVNSLVVIPSGREADTLSPLPITLLAPSDDLSAVFSRWGIHTLGDLAALPDVALIERLGQDGRVLQRRAWGEDVNPFIPYRAQSVVEEAVDLEWPIENAEALAFVLSGVLDRLVARLVARGWALGAIHLTLGLVDRSCKEIPLSLASPLTDVRAVLPLLMQAVRSSPPSAAIERVTARADPAAVRLTQASLFSALLTSPERLAATLARLEALVGREGVGSPAPLDTHRPDAFTVNPFGTWSSGRVEAMPRPTGGRPVELPAPMLRRVRPPLTVDVEAAKDGTPVRILGGPWKSAVRVASGPWRSCGEWWGETGWRREEWDAELASGLVVRLVWDLAQSTWFLDGIYD